MRQFILLSVFLLLLVVAFAHEYILLAEKYRLQKGDDLTLHLFVADGFNIEMERPFQKGVTKRFKLHTEKGETDLSVTANGTIPIMSRKIDFEGGGLIYLERDYARIALTTTKFLAYLKEDYIENIAQLVDPKKQEQKERYTRYIKCLVQSGSSFNDTIYKRETGQDLEIILLQNPYKLIAGSSLQAKVLFMGKPLTNKIITARNRTGNSTSLSQTARTNAAGVCTFKLSRKGEWFIHATHMIPCADKSDSDWESFWTSYSFEIDQ